MPPDMPHLDDTPPLAKSIDLAVSSEREKELRAGERVIVGLLAELFESSRPIDAQLRRMAYGWLYEQASREEQGRS